MKALLPSCSLSSYGSAYSCTQGSLATWKPKFTDHLVDSLGKKQGREEIYHHPAAHVDLVRVVAWGARVGGVLSFSSDLLRPVCGYEMPVFSIYLKNKLCKIEAVIN